MAHTTANELTYFPIPITKWEEDDQGNLIVSGKATDDSLDSDKQKVDVTWSAKALSDWLDTGGNVRVMHNPALYPAGRGLSLETSKDGHDVRALVVEPVAQRLVKNRVLRAYSIGVAEPVIERDMSGQAPGGIIRGGRIVELSLVDRPANKNCQLTLAKSEDHDTDWAVGDLNALLEKAEQAEARKDEEEPGEVAHDPDKPNAPGHEEVDESDIVKAAGDGDDGAQGVAAQDAERDNDEGDDDGGEAVKMAGDAYRSARKEWLGREPSVKGVAGGTEYLAKRADWHRWNAEGEAEGLDGTREGAARWLAKRSAAPDLAKADAAPEDSEADVTKVAAAEEEVLGKRKFTAEQRRQLAKEGKALADGSYPIENSEDLQNAATLARSGHGNVAAAKRLISRRAKELGVANPLDSESSSKADDAGAAKADGGDAKPAAPKCPTCKGDGKIRGGNMTCPDCKGKGVLKPGGKKARKAALAAVAETVNKSVALGLISEKAAQDILHQVGPQGGPLHQGGRRPLPADVAAVPRHREPDGTSGVEQLEHDASLPTQGDAIADKVPASVSDLQMKSDAPYAVARMHDALCAAWPGDAVLSDYPSLKSVADAADASWFTAKATEAAEAGKADDAGDLTALAGVAETVKAMDPAAVADARAEIHKAFSDMYPSEKIRPSDPRKPGSFQRPYLSSGHAAEHAGGAVNVPPSTDVPAPEQFHRGYLTEGHAAPSPGDHGPNNRVSPTTASARTYYTNSAKDQARLAMQSMHDHIASIHPELCPMAPSKSVMPPDLGAKNVPHASHPAAQGGIAGVGKGDMGEGTCPDDLCEPAMQGGKPKKRKKKLSKAEFLSYAARHGITFVSPDGSGGGPVPAAPAPVAPPDPVAVKALVAEQLTPLTEHYEKQIAELRSQVDKLGSQPDPAMAPVRGPMARVPATASPVEKRSLVDEARERAQVSAQAEQDDFIRYVQDQSRSPDPKVREKALTVLEKMAAAAPSA